jgi:hypothetical protein
MYIFDATSMAYISIIVSVTSETKKFWKEKKQQAAGIMFVWKLTQQEYNRLAIKDVKQQCFAMYSMYPSQYRDAPGNTVWSRCWRDVPDAVLYQPLILKKLRRSKRMGPG